MQGKEKSFEAFVEDADSAVINDAYRRAARQFSPDVTKTYAGYLADQSAEEDIEQALADAYIDIAAMGLVPEIKIALEAAANKLAREWFEIYHTQIKSLPDDRQEQYRQIKGMSDEPQDVDLAKPVSRWEKTQVQEENGTKTDIPEFLRHLLSDGNGKYPALLNKWEATVLKREMGRGGFVAWYRNPSSAAQDSLGIAYEDGKTWAVMRPDFLFFAEDTDGAIVADIVDPHGTHFADALPKLKGLAAYAEQHAGIYRRIEAVADVEGSLRSLNLFDPETRDAIANAANARDLYESGLARTYQ